MAIDGSRGGGTCNRASVAHPSSRVAIVAHPSSRVAIVAHLFLVSRQELASAICSTQLHLSNKLSMAFRMV
jgi:hypothetical protein